MLHAKHTQDTQLSTMRLIAFLAAGAVAMLSSATATVLVPRPAVWPVPTTQQLKYQGGISALIHNSMATFMHDGDPGCTQQNWNGCDEGSTTQCNSSHPSSFNPTNTNVSNWIESMKAVGMTHAVLTAKHGCGFLLWEPTTALPSGAPYTYHVNSSLPVLEMFVSAMQEAGLGHGFYFSLTNNFYLNTLG